MRSILLILCLQLSLWSAVLQQPACGQSARGNKIRVAVFVDHGANARPQLLKVLSCQTDILCRTVYGDDIRDGSLRNYDVVLFPGGSGRRQARSLAPEGRKEIRRFVQNGGLYMGICAGCYLASCTRPEYLGLIPIRTADSKHWHRGKAMLPIEFTPKGMEVFGVSQRDARVLYHNGPVFAAPRDSEGAVLTPLSFYRGEVVAPGGRSGVMVGAPAMLFARYGKGLVIAISPHPEATPALSQIEVHAIRWMYAHRNGNTISQNVRPNEGNHAVAVSFESHDDDPSSKAVVLAASLFDTADLVRYRHRHVPASQQLIGGEGGSPELESDCSGFISYVVNAVAPRHYNAVYAWEPAAAYPHAKTWARFFGSLSTDRPHEGWLRLANYRDLRAGDIIAWKKGRTAEDHGGHGNSGHVMMVLDAPGPVQQESVDGETVRYISVRVIDSSSVYHFPPEQLPPRAHQEHRNGLGIGYVRVIVSNNDQPIGYWEGTYWGEGHKAIRGPRLSPDVRFARMVSMHP